MRGSRPEINGVSRKLRRDATDAEVALWAALRNRSLNSYKFVRQAPIGRYIVDFLCRERMLVVEADGSQHQDNAYDEVRDAWLNGQGYSVLRFGNTDILGHRAQVLDTIVEALEGRLEMQVCAELKFTRPPSG